MSFIEKYREKITKEYLLKGRVAIEAKDNNKADRIVLGLKKVLASLIKERERPKTLIRGKSGPKDEWTNPTVKVHDASPDIELVNKRIVIVEDTLGDLEARYKLMKWKFP